MTPREYQKATSLTAIYPKDNDYDLIYLANGIMSEVGEIMGKNKKIIRDDNCQYSPEKIEAISKEIGDVLWYMSEIASAFGIDFNFVAGNNFQQLETTKLTLQHTMISLGYNTGYLLRHMDDIITHGYVRTAYAEYIRNTLMNIYVDLMSLAINFDLFMVDIAEENVAKLQDRKERDAIKGDGDER